MVASRNYFLNIPRKWKDVYWNKQVFDATSFHNYTQLLKIANIQEPPSLLKMDAEGYEWQSLLDIVSSNLSPEQLAIEMHFQTMKLSIYTDNTWKRVLHTPNIAYENTILFKHDCVYK